MSPRRAAALLVLAPLLGAAVTVPGAESPEESRVDFRREVRPLLSRNCFACHGPDEHDRAAGLRLDRREGAVDARPDGAPVIVPGDREASPFWRRITATVPGEVMPPGDSGHELAPEEIELLGRWIDEGAEYATHWSFEVPTRPTAPETGFDGWVRNGIDPFVAARLEAIGLAPSPEADRYTLARRLSLDLTGLPPSWERVEAFARDTRPDAYERYVDSLLASRHFGERWASVWLDLARYADSAGYGSDPLRTIWRYRDWVIEAFNANIPYDRFTELQLAGDLLPEPTTNELLATAFHRNTKTNTEGGTDDEEFRVEAVKDRTSTTVQVWMGLTMGCAECHSHKFDPISQEEFYAFSDFFNQTEDSDKPDDRPRVETPTAEDEAELARIDARIAELRDGLANPGFDVEERVLGLAERVAAADAAWRVLEPSGLISEQGSELSLDPSGVVRAGGGAERDAYTLTFASPLERITGLRIEALPAPELPGGGPGLSPGNGNFVLNELSLTVAPADPAPVRGRRVRIELPGEGRILSLAEVEVIASGRNVALRGTATQSSTDFAGPPENAIDGNTDGRFEEHSVTHTRTSTDPWWEVDLGEDYELERVRVWNRVDGSLHTRLAGARLVVLDGAGEARWSSALPAPSREAVDLDLAAGARTVPLGTPTASFEQSDYTVAKAADGDRGATSGWAIGTRQGTAQVAVFPLLTPIRDAAGARLVLRLDQTYGQHHRLGAFRVSITAREAEPRALPEAVRSALATCAETRDEAQRAALRDHVLATAPELDGVRADLAAAEAERAAKRVVTTPVMRELPPDRRRETHVLHKGSFLSPGDRVEAAVPAAFHPLPEDAPRDRRGLARWLTDARNPLTARVAVNRLWARLFGLGLVETEEDFGSQGLLPSHPGLLDWLAVEFRENGWDVKALLKTMVTSATYRQAARVDEARLALDPRNRMFSRGPRFRLSAEMVRDQALAVSGLLSRELFGPPVYPPQPDGIWQAAFNGQRSWQTSTGPDRYRRAVYVYWRRTAPYPSMETFDATTRETCTLRRIRTNTPLQAFVTLNDPAFVECAQALARRILVEGGGDERERARFALRETLLRPADEARVDVLVELLARELAHYREDEAAARTLGIDPLHPVPEGVAPADLAAWTVVAGVLLNQDAFLSKG